MSEIDPTIDLGGEEARLAQILDEYFEQLQQGQAPSRAELKAQHPDLAEQLDACLAGMDFIHANSDESFADSNERGSQDPAGDDQDNVVRHAKVLGDFRILREVGRGGMGAVYEAEQISLNRRVALKVLRFGAVSDSQALERFQREAETVAKLHHTNIVPIFSVGSERGVNYYAMQLIPGQSLDQYLKSNDGSIDPTTVAEWGLQAAEALAHAHQHEVIHRDVKPSNLIMDDDGRIWLTDFGLAKRQDDVTLSRTGAILGTPRYMSPEQASPSARPIDARTDIFSLGATLYELATGAPAFAADSAHEVIGQILGEEPPAPRSIRSRLPRDLETIILKCLEKEPSQRYASMDQVADDLRAFAEDRPIRARRPHAIERFGRWIQSQQQAASNTATVAGATVLLLALAVITWTALEHSRNGQLLLTTDEPRLVAHLLDDEGEIRQSHTVPMQSPTDTPAGANQIRITGLDAWGRTSSVDVDTSSLTSLSMRSNDELLTQPIRIKQSYAVVRTSAGARLFQLDVDGIHRVQLPRVDERAWSCRLNGKDGRSNSDSESRKSKPKDPKASAPWPVWPWPHQLSNSGLGRFDRRPFIVGGIESEQTLDASKVVAPDIDGDGVSDLIVAARHQAWVMAISGGDGTQIWTAWRGLRDYKQARHQPSAASGHLRTESTVSAPPLLIDDLNDDGVPELCISFYTNESGKPPQRWIELISGAEGKTVWKQDLNAEWFKLAPGERPPAQFLMPLRSSHRFGAGGMDSITQNGRTSRRPPTPADYRAFHDSDYVNGRPQSITFGEKSLIALPAGDRIVGFDPASGERAFVSTVTPRPALDLRWSDLDGDAYDDAVFLQERAATPRANQYRLATLATWSGKDKAVDWTNQLGAYWPGAYGERVADPKWPLVHDIDGDGKSEIIAASGSSWQGTGFNRGTPWGRVSVFRGSGNELWNTQVLTKDQQCNHFIVGPDINGDGHVELFTAAVWGKEETVFVEAVSGADGSTLWSCKQSSNRPLGQARGRGQIADLLWRRNGDKQLELVVVAAPTRYSTDTTLTTATINVDTGKITGAMGQSPARVHCADFDDDGAEEVVTFSNIEARGSVNEGGKLVITRGGGGRLWSHLGKRFQPIADLNGDGVVDLLAKYKVHGRRLHSGADGSVIWEADFSHALGKQVLLNDSHRVIATSTFQTGNEKQKPDLNGDGVPDLVFAADVFSQTPASPLLAVSGANGKPLWVLDQPTQATQATPILKFCDLDHDGRLELLFVAAIDWAMPQNRTMLSTQDANLWAAILDAHSGKLKWKYELVKPEQNTSVDMRYEFHAEIGDLNGDGVDDLIVPGVSLSDDKKGRWAALDGVSGSLLWDRRCDAASHSNPLYMVAPATIADLDGDGDQEALLLQYRDTPTGTEAAIEAVEGDGERIWVWKSNVLNADSGVQFAKHWFRDRVRPIVVRRKKGISIAMTARSPAAGARELILIDANGQTESREVLSKKNNNHFLTTARATDINDDGVDEVVLFRNDGLVSCLDLSQPAKSIWDFKLRSSIGRFRINEDSKWLSLFDSYGRNDLYLLDITTGQANWKCVGPIPYSRGMMMGLEQVGWLSLPDQSASGVKPIACHQWSGNTVIQLGHRLPGATTVETPGSTDRPANANLWRGRSHDERWLRLLPWANEVRNQHVFETLRFLVIATILSALLVIVPLWYMLGLIRARRFGMNAMMFAFVLIGFFLSAVNFPLDGFDRGVVARVTLSLFFAPLVIFVGSLLIWIWRQQWKKAAIWCLLTLAISSIFAVVAVVGAAAFAATLIPGERYSLVGAWTILMPGIYGASFIFGVRFLAQQTISAIRGVEAATA